MTQIPSGLECECGARCGLALVALALVGDCCSPTPQTGLFVFWKSLFRSAAGLLRRARALAQYLPDGGLNQTPRLFGFTGAGAPNQFKHYGYVIGISLFRFVSAQAASTTSALALRCLRP